ncbi:carbonic anhydrase [Auricularia subglabra TFB-10046 SS5]|nr:carbonic anhydrase [Auricularia subglabra TFB-10046 SS5]
MLVAFLLTLRLIATAYACIYRRASDPVCAPWSYSSETGPLLWAGLPKTHGCTEDWSACRLGTHQSPVVIYTASPDWTPIPTGALVAHIDDVSAGCAVLENLNTTLEVPVHGGVPRGSIAVRLPDEPETAYTLLQFHFHTPSEHRIDEEHYPLEMHLVFQADSGALAVVGVLFQLAANGSNALLDGVFANLPQVTAPGAHAPTGALPFAPLLSAINSGEVYTYEGSLTTPPCSEGVRWFVLRDARPLGVELYNAVKHVMKFNARYTQNAPGGENLLELARRQRGLLGSTLMVQV